MLSTKQAEGEKRMLEEMIARVAVEYGETPEQVLKNIQDMIDEAYKNPAARKNWQALYRFIRRFQRAI